MPRRFSSQCFLWPEKDKTQSSLRPSLFSAPKISAKTPHPLTPFPSSLFPGEREEGEGSQGEGRFSYFGVSHSDMSDGVKALEPQRTRRRSFWLRPTAPLWYVRDLANRCVAAAYPCAVPPGPASIRRHHITVSAPPAGCGPLVWLLAAALRGRYEGELMASSQLAENLAPVEKRGNASVSVS